MREIERPRAKEAESPHLRFVPSDSNVIMLLCLTCVFALLSLALSLCCLFFLGDAPTRSACSVGEESSGRALMHSMKGQNLSDVVAVISFAASRARPDEEDLIIAKVVLRYISTRVKGAPHELSNFAKVGSSLLPPPSACTHTRTHTNARARLPSPPFPSHGGWL